MSPSLLAQWAPPTDILLDEDFEGGSLPANWTVTSQGQGWDTASIAQFGLISIPPHSYYMLVNDGAAGPTNNGCCDFLITPELDLSGFPAYHLVFQSFFPGNYGQLAQVVYSTDQGQNWNILQTLNPYPAWKYHDIDLSSISGAGGLTSIIFAFHADDQGYQASGWAVDDIRLFSDSLGVLEYQVSLDGNVVGNTTDRYFQFDPGAYIPGNDYTCCVTAVYPSLGMSPPVCEPFPDLWMTPPQNLTAIAIGDSIVFTWESLSYNSFFHYYIVYCSQLPTHVIQTSDTSIIFYYPAGELCIDVTAVYDLAPFGFPGILGESVKSNKCSYGVGGFALPFSEDWNSGLFGLNRWEAGANWTIDGQVGNDAPCVRFSPPPGKGTYQSTLTSWYLDATGISECSPAIINLEFDIRLDDPGNSGTDSLRVQISIGDHIYTIAEYTNESSFDWSDKHKIITSLVRGTAFRISFEAFGSSTGGTTTWYIDNIRVFYSHNGAPQPFEISIQHLGDPENDLLLSWEAINANSIVYILDDGSKENWMGAYEHDLWIGNEFPVPDAGLLQSASVYMTQNPGSWADYTIDVFDMNRSLLATSGPLIPVFGGWAEVDLPDVPFDQGFYCMLHIHTTLFSDHLGIDVNGPNASGHYSWAYDGTIWGKISDFGYDPGVFMLRVTANVEGKETPASAFKSRRPINLTRKEQNNNQRVPISKVSLLTDTLLSDCDTIGYSVYRRAYVSYPPGSNTWTGDWEWLGCTPKDTPQFIDYDLSNELTNCYEYSIAVIYPEGESLSEGLAWDCIFVNSPEFIGIELLSIYPNPADEYLNIELHRLVGVLRLYDPFGRLTLQRDVTGEELCSLDTSGLPDGIYLVKLQLSNGLAQTKKIIIAH